MWLYDKLFNRKIEGKSSLDNLEPLVSKVSYEGDKVKINADVQVEGLTSKGIANTGNLANIGDVAVSGNGSFTGTVSANKVNEEGDTELIDLSAYIPTENIKSHTLYAKAYVRHGFLFIVCSGIFITKEISSALNLTLFNNFLSALPDGIGEKIYRADGTKITQTGLGVTFGTNVAGVVSPRSNGSTQTQNQCILSSYAANSLTLTMRGFPALAEDTAVFIDARFVLTL